MGGYVQNGIAAAIPFFFRLKGFEIALPAAAPVAPVPPAAPAPVTPIVQIITKDIARIARQIRENNLF